MRRVVLISLACLGGCGNGQSASKAMAQEKVELTACRTTYPPGTGGFASLVGCEMGAAASYVQATDPSENQRLADLAAALTRDAAEVDAGHLSLEDWRARVRDRLSALPASAKRSAQGTEAIL